MNDKELNEVIKSLKEQGLISMNPKNDNEAQITEKGYKEVMRWKDKYKEMDFLLFLFNGTIQKVEEIIKGRKL